MGLDLFLVCGKLGAMSTLLILVYVRLSSIVKLMMRQKPVFIGDLKKTRWSMQEKLIWQAVTFCFDSRHEHIDACLVRKSNALMIKKLDQGRSGHDASISDALHAENVGFDSEKIRSHRAHGQKHEQQWLEATKRCLLKLCGSQNSYADFAMAVWLLEVVATAGADVMAPYVRAEVCPPLERVFITRPYPNQKHCLIIAFVCMILKVIGDTYLRGLMSQYGVLVMVMS